VTILQAVPLRELDSDTRVAPFRNESLASRVRLAPEPYTIPPRRERQHTEGIDGPAEPAVAQPQEEDTVAQRLERRRAELHGKSSSSIYKKSSNR
jgi:hypothetical protein